MLPPIFALLKAAPAVTNIVGANPTKVYHRRAPQGTAAPYVVWFVVNDTPENNLSDPPPTDRVTLQVDAFTVANGNVDALADAVRDAIEPLAHMTGRPIDQREDDTNLDRIGMQFDWWLNR
jgi:hypothetical protein